MSKEVEEAINKARQLQQFIKEKGKDFCFYDNENVVIGYGCLTTALGYVKELEKERDGIYADYQDLGKAYYDSIPKQVIKDKIENLKSYKGMVMYEKYNYEAIIRHLEELLESEVNNE